MEEIISIVVLHVLRQSVPEHRHVILHYRCVSHVCFEEAWLDACNLDSKRHHV